VTSLAPVRTAAARVEEVLKRSPVYAFCFVFVVFLAAVAGIDLAFGVDQRFDGGTVVTGLTVATLVIANDYRRGVFE
jgi:hypothetical protein